MSRKLHYKSVVLGECK